MSAHWQLQTGACNSRIFNVIFVQPL